MKIATLRCSTAEALAQALLHRRSFSAGARYDVFQKDNPLRIRYDHGAMAVQSINADPTQISKL